MLTSSTSLSKHAWLLGCLLLLIVLGITTNTRVVNAEESNYVPEDNPEEIPTQDEGDQEQTNQDKVTIYPSGFPVYQDGAANKTLYISGNGFTADLEFEFEPELLIGKRVSMTLVTSSGATTDRFALKLIKGKTWLKEAPALPFTTLYIKKASRGGKVIFNGEISVARIFPRPEISADYQAEKIKHDQPELIIKGTNLSPKETKFLFEPPLEALKDYDYVIDENGSKMTLTLKRKSRWRSTSGPLQVVAILGGPGRINLPKPVTVAIVAAPEGLDAANEVEELIPQNDPPTIYRTYKGTSQFNIVGKGFRSEHPPTIKFQGDAAVQDEDFEVNVISKTELTLRLKKSSSKGWLQKPGVLTIEEFNGERLGFPIDVAVVFDTPEVDRDRKQLVYESQTVSIVVTGSGFVDDDTVLELSPALKVNEDYEISVRDPKLLELVLVKGKKWPRGPLNVVWVQTSNGRKIYQNKDQQAKGVRIALVEPDFGGVVQVQASMQKIYQTETLTLKVDVLVLPPKFEMKEGEDIPVQVEFASAESNLKAVSGKNVKAFLQVSETTAATLVMELKDPKEAGWLSGDGRLQLTAIYLPAGSDKKPLSYPLGNKDEKRGVQIASVLPDIRITNILNPAPLVFASHTTSIPLLGSGFTFTMGNIFDAESVEDDEESPKARPQPIVFDPELKQDEDFMVIFEKETFLKIELLRDKRWRASPGPLKLVSLDSGAGPVKIDVVIARVVEDDPDAICFNDCPPVYDGHCNDDQPNPETGELDCFGHDCADCGPRKKDELVTLKGESAQKDLCSDTCGDAFVGDGVCQDGRPGSWFSQCPLCSDCSDCGACPENKYANVPLCTNGAEGSDTDLVPGIPCVFPFTYREVTYDGSTGCVKDGRVTGGWGWCPITEDYERDGKWGSCQFCSDVTNDPSMTWDYYGDQDGEAGRVSMPEKSKKGFDFVRWIVNTLFFLVIFVAIGSLFVVVYRRRSGAAHRYQPVDTKAA